MERLWRGSGNTDLPLGLTNVVAVSVGSGNLALKADGTVVAWGWNGWDAQWTNGLSELTNVVAISAGYREWLALKADGTVTGGGCTDTRGFRRLRQSRPHPAMTTTYAQC
jgi:alpha-tubulin suppressor-like RCC1 family protein